MLAVGAVATALLAAGALVGGSVLPDAARPVAAPGAAPAAAVPAAGDRHGRAPAYVPAAVPSRRAVSRARAYARRRAGRVSFAVADGSGRLHCHRCRRAYRSASLSKAMLLVAELRRLVREGEPLTPATRSALSAMVTASDNDAADVVFSRHGDRSLARLARATGMRDFAGGGWWSEARLTARDQARFFARLQSRLPRRYRAFGRHLLRTVVSWQAWGNPRATRPRWRVLFKGGWRPERTGGFLVHQAARLERADRLVTVAVLTDGNPSHAYGTATVEGITRRLLPGP